MTEPLELDGVTWTGEAVDDPEILEEVPGVLRDILSVINGFVLFGGALHVRGAVRMPSWHSLRSVWKGPSALCSLYPGVAPGDVPFAQDCVGDQLLLRGTAIVSLSAETGQIAPLAADFPHYLRSACRDPRKVLGTEPLERHIAEHGPLRPGRVILAYPPFCTQEAAAGVALADVPADEALRFHAEFAAGIRGVPDGLRVVVKRERAN